MAYSEKLIAANEKMVNAYDFGSDSVEYKTAKAERLKVFAEVAMEIGEPALAWESPYDSIMESIYSHDNKEWIEEMLGDFKEMVDCLESIGYYAAKSWREEYEECKAAFTC